MPNLCNGHQSAYGVMRIIGDYDLAHRLHDNIVPQCYRRNPVIVCVGDKSLVQQVKRLSSIHCYTWSAGALAEEGCAHATVAERPCRIIDPQAGRCSRRILLDYEAIVGKIMIKDSTVGHRGDKCRVEIPAELERGDIIDVGKLEAEREFLAFRNAENQRTPK